MRAGGEGHRNGDDTRVSRAAVMAAGEWRSRAVLAQVISCHGGLPVAELSAAVLMFVELARIWEALKWDNEFSVINCCYLQTRLLNYSAEPRVRSYAILLFCNRRPLRTCLRMSYLSLSASDLCE